MEQEMGLILNNEQKDFCKVPNLKMVFFIIFSWYFCFNPEAAK